jgi:hypothetical protein
MPGRMAAAHKLRSQEATEKTAKAKQGGLALKSLPTDDPWLSHPQRGDEAMPAHCYRR